MHMNTWIQHHDLRIIFIQIFCKNIELPFQQYQNQLSYTYPDFFEIFGKFIENSEKIFSILYHTHPMHTPLPP